MPPELKPGLQKSDGPGSAGRLEPGDRLASWPVALLLAVVAAAMVFAGGLLGPVSMGDEVNHFGFAKTWADGGLLERPVFNPIFQKPGWPGYYYASDPLWPLGLGALWRLTGVHPWIGELYQAAWFVLLLLGLYLAGRQLTDPRGGMAAMLIGMTVPMFSAFSVFLFPDVMASALATLTLLALLRRHWLLAGLGLALIYLAKRNAFFLAAPFGLWVFFEEFPWRAAWNTVRSGLASGGRWRAEVRQWQLPRRLVRGALFMVPCLLVYKLDSAWRIAHMPAESDPGSLVSLRGRFGMLLARQQLNSYLTNPLDDLKYLGPLLLALLICYLGRRLWRQSDGRLVITALLFLAATVLLFSLDTDVRYIMPVIPVLVLLALLALGQWRQKTVVLALLAATGLATVGATSVYVGSQRQITEGQKAVFEYLRRETPPGALVLYPGELLMAQSERPVIWAQVQPLPYLLREHDSEAFLALILKNKIDYIAIFKPKIVDDTGDGRLPNGYPRWWVEQLRTPPFGRFLEEIKGPWTDMELWRVRPGVAPLAPPAANATDR